jgi:2-polyprenyl-6-methoxyphenol hydroxylase-like FAD-dependent oxidoreductase
MSADKSKPCALVIGGSFGGLCAGVCLRAAGWRVSIFERSPGLMDDRGAGIVLQSEALNLLEGLKLAARADISVESRERQYLNKDGSVGSSGVSQQFMTSWGALFNSLRRGFPDDNYHTGFKLVNFTSGEREVTARFENGREETGDLLIGGDGAWSAVRQQLLPKIAPEYAGYVAWRGVVAENALSAALLETFLDKFTFFQMPRSHILCYAIPGADGSITKGKRRLNWVWYWNYREADELSALLTDRTGRKRRTSVPPGMVCPEHWQKQMDIARALLSPQFRELLEATEQPFAQPVRDLAVPQMVFGRTVLVGEAAFVLRPHTAAAAAKAAADGMMLGQALRDGNDNLAENLRRFETPQMQMGLHLRDYGVRAGNQSQFRVDNPGQREVDGRAVKLIARYGNLRNDRVIP